jgi:hypothetical protein
VIHAAPKLDIQELMEVSKQLSTVLSKEVVQEMHTNKDLINRLVADNIDYVTPEPGAVIYKLCLIAKERNIDYTPTQDSQMVLFAYCDNRGLQIPIDI